MPHDTANQIMIHITFTELKHKVDGGDTILWVGSDNDSRVLIRLSEGMSDSHRIFAIDIDKLPKPVAHSIVEHNEATSGTKKFVGVTWQRRGWLRAMRIASIYGININSRCKSGLKSTPMKQIRTCVMGYDIETSQHLTKNGSFPPYNSRITSIALWCSCGYCKVWTTIKHTKLTNIKYCITSSQLVRESIEDISQHMPQWLVGYNCYQFDNCVLAYHSPPSMKILFKSINSGSKSRANYSFYINLTGINNVDLYSYLDKCLRRKYTALGLGSVAEYHKIGNKTQMPTTDDEKTVYSLIDYNINDSKLTSKLWNITGVCNQVIGLCVASCSPVVDCVRYISGTMASCAISSYCISNNMVMDWSECNLRIGYEGGTVLTPVRKLFKSVVVVDFSSMYPTIIRDVGISPENVCILGNCSRIHEDKLLDFNNGYTMVCIKGKIVKYKRNASCIARDVLNITVSQRAVYRISDPDYATAFKILGNSLYGAFGFASSPLHSPRAAASVTLLGRIALSLAYAVFTGLGLTVAYGDTDSCMLAEGSSTKRYFNGNISNHITFALDTFHNVIKYSPFTNMRMEREGMYKAILLVDKKHYAYVTEDGTIATKGLSSTRKDRLGICRDMTGLVAEQILNSEDIEDARKVVSNLLDICFSSILSGTLDMYMVSREVRYEGNTCYRYTNRDGVDVNIPVARADRSILVDYDTSKVHQALEADMDRICIPAGLGSVSSMLQDSDAF